MANAIKTPGDGKTNAIDFILSTGQLALNSWLLMLLLGTLHSDTLGIPAWGYWSCVFIAWVFSCLVSGGVFTITQRIRSLTPLYGKKVPQVDEVTLRRLADALKTTGKGNQ